MGNERRAGPVEGLRNLVLALERMAAREAASGVVRGAADGLRKELPELDGQVHALLQDALTVLGRLAREAAEREPVEPGAVAHAMASAATKGALEVLEREWQDGGMPLHSFVERINRLLDEVVEFARSRTDEIHTPGERAQAMTRGVVKAALEQVHEAAPVLAEDVRKLAPGGAEVASKVGRGLVEGLASKLREEPDLLAGLLEGAGRGLVRGLAAGLREELAAHPGRPWPEALGQEGTLRRVSRELTGGVLEALGGLRRPLMAVAGAGSALVALSLMSLRWRRA